MEVVSSAGLVDYRHFIFANGIKVASYSRTSASVNTLYYLRQDLLGGVSGIISADGTSFVKESFSAFGARRSACDWKSAITAGDQALMNAVTRHGYTWQTALGNMGLNDMNGRVQDAVTGRFLSADPYITQPENTQNFNRYSYVLNNPLRYVDPSDLFFGLHYYLHAKTRCLFKWIGK